MLLIGDIHITTRHTNAILDAIRWYVAHFPEEKNVVFMGDYMYMFSYDRKALGELFDLFLSLRKEGRNVYILAGNHDRIGQQFVYAEGKKITDMIPTNSGHVLRFITSPEVHQVEGKDILFFPFSKHVSTSQSGLDREKTSDIIKSLLASKNNNERLSWEINLILAHYIQQYKELTIIHHYYIANTKFPGQQAIFDYKDIALCPDILDNDNIQLISWHIHMPFAHKNYLCTWSVWYTSPLEVDHHKFLYQRDTASNTINAYQVAINPYIVLQTDGNSHITKANLISHRETIDKKVSEIFSWKWQVKTALVDYPLAHTHVTLISESVNYENIQTKIEPDLFHTIKDRSIKKKANLSPDMSFTLEIAQKNLQESLLDRKIIVKEFIMSRFWNDFDKYRTLLDELHILS